MPVDDAAPRTFRHRTLPGGSIVIVSDSGDHAFLTQEEHETLLHQPHRLSRHRLAELYSKFIFGTSGSKGLARLLASRIATKNETVRSGPSLHILVPTLQCAHSCRYCQVSRSPQDAGFAMSLADLTAACDTIFESPSPILTVEFQGGDPLLRFDLVAYAIDRITAINKTKNKAVRFVVASTLHQLTPDICEFFKANAVCLSTSIDGPPVIHNRNRLLASRDAYERTAEAITMARQLISPDAVSAVMTTTRQSLAYPEDIVDTYVALGFSEIFIRPLSPYGFAQRNRRVLGYSLPEFYAFYERAFSHIIDLNHNGLLLREVSASIALNKILSPFDAGYVDLQSPTGAGLAVLVYNYDGYVYPSDEARMLAEMGDRSLRLGRIGEPLSNFLTSEVQQQLVSASLSHTVPGCRDCAYRAYCGPDPIGAYAQLGSFSAPVELTDHCQRQMWLFDFLLAQLRDADPWLEDLFHRWALAMPTRSVAADA